MRAGPSRKIVFNAVIGRQSRIVRFCSCRTSRGESVAAVAPDTGETVQDQLDKYPSDIFGHVEVADLVRSELLLREAVKAFVDCRIRVRPVGM